MATLTLSSVGKLAGISVVTLLVASHLQARLRGGTESDALKGLTVVVAHRGVEILPLPYSSTITFGSWCLFLGQQARGFFQ